MNSLLIRGTVAILKCEVENGRQSDSVATFRTRLITKALFEQIAEEALGMPSHQKTETRKQSGGCVPTNHAKRQR